MPKLAKQAPRYINNVCGTCSNKTARKQYCHALVQGLSSTSGVVDRHRSFGKTRLGPQEGAPPSSVRRKRHRVIRGVDDQPLQPPEQAPSSSVPIAQIPSERFTILRQWGAEATVSVLPLLYK